MGSWNYRMVRHRNYDAEGDAILIHRVAYDDDAAKGNIVGISVDPFIPSGRTEQDVDQELLRMGRAIYSPVLDYTEAVALALANAGQAAPNEAADGV